MSATEPSSLPLRGDYSKSSSGSETSGSHNLTDDEGWEDAEPEETQDHFLSLLDNKDFASLELMLAYCKDAHDFDFLQIRQNLALDFYGTIKFVNYIRSMVKDGRTVPPQISKGDFEDDKYLKPVLEDDALLFNVDELPEVIVAEETSDNLGDIRLLVRVAELEEELRKTQFQFSDYRNTVKQTLDERWNENITNSPAMDVDTRDDDSHYFTSYSYNDIHETMLKDSVRTDAYRDFIYGHKHLFAGKIVLDVGCGTGILSLFCAKAGAARVIAVDNSEIIDKARENIFNNGYAETITCLRGKIEEVTLPVEKVDIIVSEWMGYCLLYEAMLDSVIWARDRYLQPDGLMVPSHMNMWVAPIADPDYVADHFTFWRDVYGFDMVAMQAGIYDDAQVLHMPSSTLCAEPHPFLQLSLHTTRVEDLVFKKNWEATLTKDIDALDGFVIWFDTFFLPSRNDEIPQNTRAEHWSQKDGQGISFTTGPFGKETHWRQGAMFVNNSVKSIGHAKGDVLGGELQYAVPNDNSRALDVTLSWKKEAESAFKKQSWKMR